MKVFKNIIASVKKKWESQPAVNLGSVKFLIPPEVVQRNGKYFLRYQVARKEGLQLVHPLHSRKTANKAYYFFSTAVSHPEPGNLVERDLQMDGMVPYAEKDAIYWLNEDGTEIHLPVNQR